MGFDYFGCIVVYRVLREFIMSSYVELSRVSGIKYKTILSRIFNGLTPEQAIQKPVRKYTKGVKLACDLAGRSERSVRDRMAKGMTLDQAVNDHLRKRIMLDYATIKHLVEDEKLSLNRVAYLMDCSRQNLGWFCKKNGIVYDDYNPPAKKIIIDGVEYSQAKACKKMGYARSSFSKWAKFRGMTDVQLAFDAYVKFKENKNDLRIY